MYKQFIVFILFFCCFNTFSQTGKSDGGPAESLNRGLQTDVYLHPLNSNTAFTLKKGECVYNQAPVSFPLPTWAWIGITDRITAEIDFLPLVGGLFIKPNLPVPSFNFRFKLIDQRKFIPALAYETMVQYLYNEFDQSTNPFFATWRKKGSWYNHINASWKAKSNFYIHASLGCTFAQRLRLVNKDSLNFNEKVFENMLSPDLSIGIDYRLKRISFHLNTSYGSTFNYIDNVPRKFEIIYGVRLAPFYKNKYSFFRTFRIEWAGFYDEFTDIKAKAYVPIFIPYFYWQWRIINKQPPGRNKD